MIQIQIQPNFVCKHHSQCDKDTMDFAIERVLHLKPQIPSAIFGTSNIKLPAIIVQTKFLVDVSKVFSDFCIRERFMQSPGKVLFNLATLKM